MIYVHGILGKMAYTVVNLSTTVEECQLLPCENADLVRLIEVTGGVSSMDSPNVSRFHALSQVLCLFRTKFIIYVSSAAVAVDSSHTIGCVIGRFVE